eukprot:COSAG01_NODE_767_length_13740_cov_525.281651_8_plen_93_part_00
MYQPNGSLQVAKVRLLSRPYAHTVAGVPTRSTFDSHTGVFSLDYVVAAPDRNGNYATTEIFVNKRMHFPRGFTVSFRPARAALECLVRNGAW